MVLIAAGTWVQKKCRSKSGIKTVLARKDKPVLDLLKLLCFKVEAGQKLANKVN